MVLIDTSIWIQLYRQRDSKIGEMLWYLTSKGDAAICGQIYVEFIGGFHHKAKREQFRSNFQEFPFLETSLPAYQLAGELLADFPKLGSGDAIIGATAINTNSPLMTSDKDFHLLRNKGLQIISWD